MVTDDVYPWWLSDNPTTVALLAADTDPNPTPGSEPQTAMLGDDDLGAVANLRQSYHKIRAELGKIIVHGHSWAGFRSRLR